jgi:hypothetical protein
MEHILERTDVHIETEIYIRFDVKFVQVIQLLLLVLHAFINRFIKNVNTYVRQINV